MTYFTKITYRSVIKEFRAMTLYKTQPKLGYCILNNSRIQKRKALEDLIPLRA